MNGVDTLDATLPPPIEPQLTPESPEPGRFSRLAMWWVIGVVVLVALVVGGFVIWAIQPTDFYALRPGSVRDTTEAIAVEGATFHDPVGEIGFTTVTLESKVTNWEERRYKDDDTINLVPSEVIDGDQTAEERRQRSLAQMETSKDVAAVVALQFLGLAGEPTGAGALVRDVSPDSAADGVLVATDVVISADGQTVSFADDLVAAVRAHAPGDSIQLEVRHFEGDIEIIEISLGVADDDETPLLGVEVGTFDLSADFAIDVTIDSGDVSGPSAGLAFTLGIIDVLTPGELTDGRKVATTGTINLDGTVGPVGGVAQKTVAARHGGVELFIVPSSEYDDALARAGDMQVEAADTLQEAIDVLTDFGGTGIGLDEVAVGGDD